MKEFESAIRGRSLGLLIVLLSCWLMEDASSKPRCEVIFASHVHSQAPPLLPRRSQYEGEDRGEYVDPVTRAPWRVRYFNEMEREAYRVRLNAEGLFLDSLGLKMNSRFDEESLSFDESLLVVDARNRWFVLPFEERGRYHHSSLLAGASVRFAGMVAFLDGRVRRISDTSGHYRPESWRILWLLRDLRRRGANLSQIEVSGRGASELGGSPYLRTHEVKDMFLY